MKKQQILQRTIKIEDLSQEELYADFDGDWRERAARLQIRRWRKILAK
jgi:hypothetical protein